MEDDETMVDSHHHRHPPVSANGPPRQPVLQRYEVGENIFEVPLRYQLQYAIGQGAYGIVWYVVFFIEINIR